MFQKWILKKMLKNKLKGMPEAQIDMMIEMISSNPDFFKKLEREIKEKTKEGMEEQAAAMVVMRKYQSEMQQMLLSQQGRK